MTTAEGINYGVMTADEFVDHVIDENGLATFIDRQGPYVEYLEGEDGKRLVDENGEERFRILAYEEWDWYVITRDLQAFSRGMLTFSPDYLRDLYEMQRQRRDG